jgi:hypothetical protein
MTLKVSQNGLTVSHQKYRKLYHEQTITMQPPITWHSSWVNSDIGETNPNWRWQIAAGLNATTNYTKRKYEYFSLKGMAEATLTNNAGQTLILGYVGNPLDFFHGDLGDPVTLDASLVNRACRQRFIGKYRAKRTAFQGGIFLGELAQTVKMIKNPASKLRELITQYYNVAKKRQKSVRVRRRTIQDSWLEFAYGVKPLVGDIKDAMSIATADPFRVYKPIKVGATGIEFTTTTKLTSDIWDGVTIRATKRKKGTTEGRLIGVVGFENYPPSFPEQMGLSWSNVLPIGWELCPWSFLIDYFTNVGKVIEGISTGTVSLRWGCYMYTGQLTSEFFEGYLDQDKLQTITPPGGSSYGFASLAGLFERHTIYSRERIDQVSLGLRDLHMKLPDSGIQWLNMAALYKMKQLNPANVPPDFDG